jgi:hypothetical protein
MKNPMPLLVDFVRTSRQRTPTFRARMKYGARLRGSVRHSEKEIERRFSLTRKRRLESRLD